MMKEKILAPMGRITLFCSLNQGSSVHGPNGLKRIISLVMVLIYFLIGVTGCGKDHETERLKKNNGIYTVKPVNHEDPLSYSGTLKPIRTFTLTSPVDATITKVYFSYGQMVQKKQLLLELSSPSLDKDYQSALSEYLTAKDKYDNSAKEMIGTKDLYHSGIISRNEYDQDVSNFNTAYLQLLQTEHKLKDLLRIANIKTFDFAKLHLNDMKTINQYLKQPVDHIKLYAAADGVALKPEKQQTLNNEEDNQGLSLNKLAVGEAVKKDQSIVTIGDMSGARVAVEVDQVNINAIREGQKTEITSSAFPDVTLQGYVSSVTAQANDNTENLPTFPVLIDVPHISERQREVLRVGMNVKVTIFTAKTLAIKIPIQAVIDKNHETFVKKLDTKSGKMQLVPVKTGITDLEDVVIVEGLKPGDRIVNRH